MLNTAGGKEIPPFNNGEKVTLQHGNKWVPPTVISKHDTHGHHTLLKHQKVRIIGKSADT